MPVDDPANRKNFNSIEKKQILILVTFGDGDYFNNIIIEAKAFDSFNYYRWFDR